MLLTQLVEIQPVDRLELPPARTIPLPPEHKKFKTHSVKFAEPVAGILVKRTELGTLASELKEELTVERPPTEESETRRGPVDAITIFPANELDDNH